MSSPDRPLEQSRADRARIQELERMLARVLPYVHAEPHWEHSALHDEAQALLNRAKKPA